LVLSFFGLAQFVGAQAPASAAPPSCPQPTTQRDRLFSFHFNITFFVK